MSKNTIIVAALAVVAILSVLSLFLTGAISLGGGDDKGEKSEEEILAELDLGEDFDANASHVRIEPFNVAIIQNNRVRGALYVLIDLETGHRNLNIEVVKSRPRLRDAYLKALSRYAGHQIDPGKPVNIMLVKRILQRATDAILGDPSATVVVSAAHISEAIR